MNLSRLLLPLMLAVLAGCAGTKSHDSKNLTTNSQGRYIARDTSRTVDLTNPPSDAWDRIRRGFAIPNLNTELSQRWTDYYASHPESVQRMAERAGKYLYFIVDEINRRGLPTELALLPFVESAYNPTALSRAQASGLWQFVPATGQHFNLKQDWWRDERRDPIASTNAALDYLESCSKCRATGTWRWPRTTGAKAPCNAPWPRTRPPASPPTTCPCPCRTRPATTSQAAGHQEHHRRPAALRGGAAAGRQHALLRDGAQEQRHRPGNRRQAGRNAAGRVQGAQSLFQPPGHPRRPRATLLLPADRVEIFNANLTNYKGDLSAWKVYHSRRGDPTRPSPSASASARPSCAKPMTSARARRSRQPVHAGAGRPRPRHPGSLAGPAVGALDSAPASSSKAAPHGRATPTPPARVSSARPNVRTHKIRQGDTLFSLAKQYGTTVDALRALSNLKGNALKVGGQLRVPGTNARGRGPRALRASPGAPQRTGKAGSAPLIWRGPGLVWLVGREACH